METVDLRKPYEKNLRGQTSMRGQNLPEAPNGKWEMQTAWRCNSERTREQELYTRKVCTLLPGSPGREVQQVGEGQEAAGSAVRAGGAAHVEHTPDREGERAQDHPHGRRGQHCDDDVGGDQRSGEDREDADRRGNDDGRDPFRADENDPADGEVCP